MSQAPAWQPARLYYTGDIVRPTSSVLGPASNAIPNAGFEEGDTGWVKNGFAIIQDASQAFSGSWVARSNYTGASTGIAMVERLPVRPGQSVTASCMIRAVGASDQVGGQIRLFFLDANGNQLGEGATGPAVAIHQGQNWRQSSVTATAPGNAAQVYVQGEAYNNRPGAYVLFDAFQWNYQFQGPPAGLVYKAVQPEAGTSAGSEPAWPGVVGQQVVDGGVIWEAIITNRVVYRARPVMRSGMTEPDWPSVPGETVLDNNIIWTAADRRITDPNCPQSKVVAITEAKVFAGDGDKVKYSATSNPKDWTSRNDAGFLPTGLTQTGANDVEAMNLYRNSLVVLNATTLQTWQVDADPELMAKLDTIEGVGSTYQKAMQPVANDLVYLTQMGVRSVGISAASNNLQAGDIGMPVDDLIQPQLVVDSVPLGFYYPGAGQYWLAFRSEGETQVFVYSMSRLGSVGAWSRYLFPFEIDYSAVLGNDLFLRHGADVSRVRLDLAGDEVVVGGQAEWVPAPAAVQWNWLDLGRPGQDKMLDSVDVVCDGAFAVRIGYDQRDPEALTEAYAVDEETLPGDPIPIGVTAPTLSLRLEFDGAAPWEVQSAIIYTL